ncbi:3'-5' exonuclease [Ectopseudomonas toyotomiensis]|uniref:DNA polymerase-3 subunit epsilon n=1 Tax=Ectopseudomonas toyotomiensis TaxID=554344 RepID=A0A1I5QZM8_9GAMM|nr:3'-5' exonuclease [Pseudomonas toyotomiensis]PIA74273.1 3'-5' exonuclease [Pseudomonas toyotomiensis]SFP51702.1 DNA polymerase-3 subunit epsilon [Pseudomonas toyotomiensis]
MTQNINVFDFETTGIPDWKQPSEAGHQPHIVEVAALLCDAEGNIIDRYQAIVRPNGWEISPEMTEIHGISQEQAMDEGIPEIEALEGFLAIHARASIRAAHNATFDDRIARIAIARYHGKDLADSFKESTTKFCTCYESRPVLNLPGKKLPSLAEAYKHFTGEDLVEAHRAMPDALACARVYFALMGVAMPAAA